MRNPRQLHLPNKRIPRNQPKLHPNTQQTKILQKLPTKTQRNTTPSIRTLPRKHHRRQNLKLHKQFHTSRKFIQIELETHT